MTKPIQGAPPARLQWSSKKKWPTEWQSQYEPILPVTMRTVRDETGIDYEVRVCEQIIGAFYEEGENERTVWSTRREFSQREECRAGGAAFQYAARDQEEIADRWAEAICRAHGVDPNPKPHRLGVEDLP